MTEPYYKKWCDHCGYGTMRCSMGPTGRRKRWMLTVDKCGIHGGGCGAIYPIPSKALTPEQKDWVERINRSSQRYWDENDGVPFKRYEPPEVSTSTAGESFPFGNGNGQ